MTSADGTTTTRRPIVAGVDGSESSLAALRWAMRQAELTGAPLEIVSAWEWPVSWGWQPPIPPGYDPADEARRQLDKAISAVLTPGDATEARRTVIEGNPAPVLEALSKTADLIVIGSHGHGEFAGMLLGSVALVAGSIDLILNVFEKHSPLGFCFSLGGDGVHCCTS